MRSTRHRTTRTGVVGLAVAALAATAFTVPSQASSGGNGGNGGNGGTGQTAGRPAGHEETRKALDAVVRDGIPGVTSQAREGRSVWKGAAGVGDLSTGAPRGADDRFRIAGITKTFVATVMLQLETERRLDLDDTVESWLPGVVRGHGHDGRQITVRQLLNHTSGVFDFLNDPAYEQKYLLDFLKNRYRTRTPQEAVNAAMAHPPTFAPGTEYAYSNTNYVLAALIMERVTGNTYEHEVRTRIVKPLGLRATVLPGNSSLMPKPSSRAYSKIGETDDGAKIYDITHQNASQTWAEGDMISSAGDLTRFSSALMRGELLAPKQLKAGRRGGWAAAGQWVSRVGLRAPSRRPG
ncbi:serine hydrolase domain-containing protein [Streptomyces sp. NBC_01716]|uniref:serine hydrolase domain-containing protein n=1 Tax=Streptomyces sp. NBC_01716 TaxID=2975917 RepID=UPI002E3298A2|nr:serine hydrolase domain-containing protein [Streptomyces sp. NBC_01716]